MMINLADGGFTIAAAGALMSPGRRQMFWLCRAFVADGIFSADLQKTLSSEQSQTRRQLPPHPQWSVRCDRASPFLGLFVCGLRNIPNGQLAARR